MSNYFKGLNGLRFFAAFLVVIYHAQSSRESSNLIQTIYSFRDWSVFHNGGIAVEFFFVLSGFLITSLLLDEFSRKGDINIKKFYIRRILRIWPLYYLLVFWGLVGLPFLYHHIFQIKEWKLPYEVADVWHYFVFFIPNWALQVIPYSTITPLWSIGVEEQFYLIWAPIVKFLRNKIVGVFIFIIFVKLGIYIYFDYQPDSDVQGTWNQFWFKFLTNLRFESMSIGGLFAYWVRQRNRDVSGHFLFSNAFQVFGIILLVLLVFVQKTIVASGITPLTTTWYYLFQSRITSCLGTGFLFAWFIVNISLNKNSLINTENKTLNWLGNLSYGIYMYHTTVLLLTFHLMEYPLNHMPPVLSTITFYSIVVGCTIILAHFSYQYFEKPFLSLKVKYEH